MTNTTNEKVGHTPGPWTLQTVKTVCGVCHKIGPFPWKEGRENHACIYVDYPNHDGRGSYEDELMANAKLIASAPDLLADRDTLKALCVERGDKLFSLARMITMHEFGAAMDFAERIIAERSGHDHPKT